MHNPFEPPKASLWQEPPDTSEKPYYRYVNYAYAAIAFGIIGFVVAAGNWSSFVDLVLTVYILLPCATSASMLWGTRFIQSALIRVHLFAIAGLIVYGVFMVGRIPPLPVLIFSGWSLFILVWSIRIFKHRSDKSVRQKLHAA